VAAAAAPRTVTMNGPIAIVLGVLRWLIPLAAVAVVIDALRRPARDFQTPVWRWVWVVPQSVLIGIGLLAFAIPRANLYPLAVAALILLIVCVPMQIGYLLEVVFPPRKAPVTPPSEEE
jgi:hypothetical protein